MKTRKTYLRLIGNKIVILMIVLLFSEAKDNVSTVLRTEAKGSKKCFLGLSCNSPLAT